MSSNLRGATTLFENTTIDENGMGSEPGYLGAMTNAAVMVHNIGLTPVTISIQVTAGDGVPKAGRNESLDTANWFYLLNRDGTATLTFVVAPAETRAIDLSPVSPPYLRLWAITGIGDETDIDAFLVVNG